MCVYVHVLMCDKSHLDPGLIKNRAAVIIAVFIHSSLLLCVKGCACVHAYNPGYVDGVHRVK